MTDVKTKVCSTCRREKFLEDFYRNSTKLDGRSSECRDCTIGRVRGQQAEAKALDPEEFARKARESTRRWRESDKGKHAVNRQKAYNKALARLRDNHRDEFQDLLEEERRNLEQ